MKKILFRADARPSLGIGDLVSLIHISRYFEKEGWEIHFIIRNYEAGVATAKTYKITNLFVINENISIEEEVAEINKYIAISKIDVVFFEITERSLTEYKGITNEVQKACVCFDGIITDDIGLVVNWDVNAHNLFDKSKYPNTKFLLGPEYVILPAEFDNEKINNRKHSLKPETLLIVMGGADELNFTQKIVDVLIQNEVNLKINVIVGSGYEYKKELERSVNNVPMQFNIERNVTDMFDEYMNCDVAIGAGGLTSYELIATRTPAILIALYEHQVARCLYFSRKGLARYSGFRMLDNSFLLENIFNPFVLPPFNSFKAGKIVENTVQLLK